MRTRAASMTTVNAVEMVDSAAHVRAAQNELICRENSEGDRRNLKRTMKPANSATVKIIAAAPLTPELANEAPLNMTPSSWSCGG